MKKLYLKQTKKLLVASLLIASLSSYSSFARERNAVTQHLQTELQVHQSKSLNLFTLDKNYSNEKIEKEFKDPIYLKLNKSLLSHVQGNGMDYIAFTVPLSATQSRTIYLGAYNILADGFKVYAGNIGSYKEVNVEPGKHFRGFLSDEDNSLAAFSFYNNELIGLFSTDEGNFNLVPNGENPGNGENYILYREENILDKSKAPKCFVDDQYRLSNEEEPQPQGLLKRYDNCKVTRISITADYELYKDKSQNVTTTTNYIRAVFNGMAMLYANERIYVSLSEVKVNNAADGYTYNSSSTVLNQFGNNTRMNFDGDLASIASGYRSGDLGGVAWLDVLCANYRQQGSQHVGPYSFANLASVNNVPTVPTYSWDVECITHEIGHNLGSEHTHNCTAWTGGPIDWCAPTYQASLREGNCNGSAALNPSSSVKGTVMSYCHLLSSVGINFNNGFGPQPGNKVRSKVASASCLDTYIPTATLATVNSRTANRQCNDGTWTHYYYDNNTIDQADDELLLSIAAGSQNIGTIDDAGFSVKVVEVTGYNTGAGKRISAPYTATNPTWTVMNRYFKITPVTQPTSAVTVRFPFTTADYNDVKGSMPYLTAATQLKLFTINNNIEADPVANHNNATTANVTFYNNGSASSTTAWALGTSGTINYAEFKTNHLNSGGLGTDSSQFAPASIQDVYKTNALSVYPNPASNQLFIQLAAFMGNDGTLEVYDNLGRLVYSKEVVLQHASVLDINTSGFAKGMYTIRLKTDEKVLSTKFMKQ